MPENGPLHALEFTRYRAFERRQRLEIKPMTLLFGHNSAGKSAALRLLPILAASANRVSSAPTVLDYSAPALRDATFRDLIHNGQLTAGLEFKLIWQDAEYEFTLRDIGAGSEIVSAFDFTRGDDKYSGSPLEEDEWGVFRVKGSGEPSNWKLAGITPSIQENTEVDQAADDLRTRLRQFSNSVYWMGAVRATVPRYFELRPDSDGRIWPDGSGVAQALRLSASAGDGAAEAVSNWLKKTCRCSLQFSASDEVIVFNRRFYQFDLHTMNGGRVAVRDVGEGIAQALPVVTQCHRAKLGHLGPNPILAFEQPELHLHPAASLLLADEIVACIDQGSSAKHVIETHAESMLLSVQIAIVENRLDPKDVVVYWVAGDEDGTSLRRITFDEAGFPVGGWPQGVFRETLNQARRLAQLRIHPDDLHANTDN